MNNKKLFLLCDCYNHGLLLEKEEDEDIVYLSVFERGVYKNKLNWYERLRWIYQIFVNGTPWTDQFILNKEKQKQIIEYLEDVKNKT
jgi:hypothetical protein